MPDRPESTPITLKWLEDIRPDSIPMALLWAALGGALIGGLFLASANTIDRPPSSLKGLLEIWLFGIPFMALASLIVVIPCTLVFGLPSALLIRKRALRRWQALGVCVGFAVAAQIIACFVLWQGDARAVLLLFSSPYALGAAVVLWWRLAPPA